MKVLDHITDAVVRRVPVRRSLLSITETVTDEPRLNVDHHVRLRFEIALRQEMTGPIEATSVMRRRATRLFLHEHYGDVADELIEVLRQLYGEDHYRAPDDPEMSRLSALVGKLRGEGV